jgi:hypothetical protein
MMLRNRCRKRFRSSCYAVPPAACGPRSQHCAPGCSKYRRCKSLQMRAVAVACNLQLQRQVIASRVPSLVVQLTFHLLHLVCDSTAAPTSKWSLSTPFSRLQGSGELQLCSRLAESCAWDSHGCLRTDAQVRSPPSAVQSGVIVRSASNPAGGLPRTRDHHRRFAWPVESVPVPTASRPTLVCWIPFYWAGRISSIPTG